MSRKAKALLYSTAVLGVLGATGVGAIASSTHGAPYPLNRIKYFSRVIPAKNSKKQVRNEAKLGRRAMNNVNLNSVFTRGKGKVTEPYIKNYGYTSKFTGRHYATKSGSIDEGSPLHHTIRGVIANGHDYDISLGRFHSHLEATNLGKGHRVIRIVNPQVGKKYAVVYPNSVILAVRKGKKVKYMKTTALLVVRPMREYKPWRGNRSIVFSKDVDSGYMYNGYTQLFTKILLLDPRTMNSSHPKSLDLSHSWMFFRDINGLSPYKYPGTLDGEDAWRNDMEWVRYGDTHDTTGEYIENESNNGQKQYSYKGIRGLTHQNKRGIRTIKSHLFHDHVDGGVSNTPYNDDAGFGNVSHDIFFKLSGDSANFTNGTSVGYGNFTPLFNTGINVKNPKKPTLYHCHIDKSGQPVTNLTVGTKASRYQLSDGHKFKISKAQYKHIVNDEGKVTKHGLKYWEDNIMPCPVTTPQRDTPAHPKINPFHPTKPVKYVTGVHTMKTINADGMTFHNQGGALSHPNQTYTYHIDGKLPNRTIDNTPAYKYINTYDAKGHITGVKQVIDHYYDGHTDDYWAVTDKLPKYVSIKKANVDINGATATHDKHHVYVNFDHDTWDANNGGTYHITIKVQANHLPHLSENEASHKHWIQMLNGGDYDDGGGFNTDTYADGQNDGNYVSPKYSNPVPTEIKLIKANIWHYDYNYDRHVTHNWFPDNEQPMGITNDVYNPLDDDFKNYRYHGNFNQNSGDVLKHQSDSWYAGSYHNVNTLTNIRNDNGHGHYYRVAYPTLQDTGYYDAGFPIDKSHSARHNQIQEFSPHEFNEYEGYIFNDDKNQINPPDMSTYSDDYSFNGSAVLMNANPDGTDEDGDDNNAFTDSGYTQNDYIPYYVPRVSLNQHINPRTGKAEAKKNDYRMIIDTDKTNHGLPFRLDMRAQNLLYGTSYKDFKGVYVKMDITTNNGNDELYSDIRPLAGNSQKALIHQGTYHKHTHTLSESPKGTNDYHGYIEADALKQAESHNYDLNTNPDLAKNKQPDKPVDLPIHVHFKLVNKHGHRLSKANSPEVDMKDIDTHAYISGDPRVTGGSFGHKLLTHNGKTTDDTISNPAEAIFSQPERTIEYGDGNVRELNEKLAVNQPRHAVGKTGYGISANDLGISYMGHLEAPHYAHYGTNMQAGFPRQFNAYDSNLSYGKDTNDTYAKNRGMQLRTPANEENGALGANLLHVKPFIKNSVPEASDLDTAYTSNHVDSDDDVDDMFDDAFPEHLHSGNFSTTYGFYPKASVHDNPTSAGNAPQDNGNVLLSGDFAHGYGVHPSYHDAQFNNNEVNKFGLDTKTEVTHSDNPAKEAQIKANNLFTNLNEASDPDIVKNLDTDGQNERLYTPKFMETGKYGMTFHRAYKGSSRFHRLGGNFFNIDEYRPIKMLANQYLTKDSQTPNYDELSLQPILTNPNNGLMQTPLSNPAFPALNDYHTGSKDTGWLTQSLWAGAYGNYGQDNNMGIYGK